MKLSTKLCCLALLCVALFAAVALCDDPAPTGRRSRADLKFENFRVRYGRRYRDSNEENYRKNVFLENLQRAEALNESDEETEYGVTPFADLTDDEFAERVLMINDELEYPDPPENSTRALRAQAPRNTDAAPANFDWRTRGALTPVKNQGSCGSCWAWSVIAEVESQTFLAGRGLTPLSAQQVVDCDTSNWGCGGGWPATAYAYILRVGGVQSAATYPYAGRAGSCKFSRAKVVSPIKSWTWSSRAAAPSETQMMNDLYTYGPLSVCISARNWNYYTGGVFSGASGSALDHCVQLVGYGVTSTGAKYWTIKNQWGSTWGENGYMRLRRGVNQSLIANYATRVVV